MRPTLSPPRPPRGCCCPFPLRDVAPLTVSVISPPSGTRPDPRQALHGHAATMTTLVPPLRRWLGVRRDALGGVRRRVHRGLRHDWYHGGRRGLPRVLRRVLRRVLGGATALLAQGGDFVLEVGE